MASGVTDRRWSDLTLPANKLIIRICSRRPTELVELKRQGAKYMWKENADVSTEPTTGTLTTYREAVVEFRENARKFIECIPLLTKSRDAYQQAMRASRELRRVLDVSDETLLTLMSHLELAVKGVEEGAPDRKKPEPMKVRSIKEEGGAHAVNEIP
jgi:hypothetical protein